MDPKLIEAAAKLCGWQRYMNRWSLRSRWMTSPDLNPEVLTNSGLLALEDALGGLGWVWDRPDDEGGVRCFRWRKRKKDALIAIHEFLHPDRATAACLAAQEELGHE